MWTCPGSVGDVVEVEEPPLSRGRCWLPESRGECRAASSDEELLCFNVIIQIIYLTASYKTWRDGSRLVLPCQLFFNNEVNTKTFQGSRRLVVCLLGFYRWE